MKPTDKGTKAIENLCKVHEVSLNLWGLIGPSTSTTLSLPRETTDTPYTIRLHIVNITITCDD